MPRRTTRFLMLLSMLLFIPLCLRSQVPGEDWTRIAVLGIHTSAIVVSPNYLNDGTVFAGTEGMGVYRSTDFGATWTQTPTATLATRSVADLAISPSYASDHTLFAITTDGRIYRSTNADTSFTFLLFQEAPSALSVGTSLAIHPLYNNPSGSNLVLFAGFAGEGLFFTTDGGGSWQQDLAKAIQIRDLAISPAFGVDGHLFVGGHDPAVSNPEGPVWRRDGIASPVWHDSSQGLAGGAADTVLSLAISPSYVTTGKLWAGTQTHGMWWNPDAGNATAAWSARCDGTTGATRPSVKAIAVSPSSAPKLLEGRADKLRESTTDGASCFPSSFATTIEAIVFQPGWNGSSNCHVYLGTPHGLFRQSCAAPKSGPAEVDGRSVALAPGGLPVLMGSLAGGLYKSKDGQGMVRFSNFPADFAPQVTVLKLGPNYTEGGTCGDEGLVFAAVNFPDDPGYPAYVSGVYRSTDFGNTWTFLSAGWQPQFPKTVNDIAMTPDLSLGKSGSLFAATTNGLYRWDEISSSWSANLLPGVIVDCVAVPPSYISYCPIPGIPCQTVFIATHDDIVSGFPESQVYYSIDNGDSWTLTGYPGVTYAQVRAFAFPFNFGLSGYSQAVYAAAATWPGSTGGVYTSSTPPYSSWVGKNTGLGNRYVWGLAAEPRFLNNSLRKDLLCATNAGVYRSADAGDTWSLVASSQKAYSVAYDPSDTTGSRAAAGYQVAGAAVSGNGGISFTTLTGYGDLPGDVYNVIPHMRNRDVLFASSPTWGAFVSEDRGVSFRPWNAGGGVSQPCFLDSALGLGMMTDRCGTNVDVVYAGTNTGGIKYRRMSFDPTSGEIDLDLYSWRNTSGSTTAGRFERFDALGTGTMAKIWTSSPGYGIHYLPSGGCSSWFNAAIPTGTATYIKYGYAAPDPSAPRPEGSPQPDAPSSATQWGTVNGSGVYKGSDSAPALPAPSAITWVQRNGTTQPLTNLSAQCIAQLNDLTLVVGCNGGVFHSPAPDEGQTTWIESTSGVAGSCSYDFRDLYYMHPASGGNGDLLMAANGTSDGGVWLSGDKGRHWMRISNGFNVSERGLEDIVADDGNPPSYYSSTDSTGVYTRTISANPYPLVTGLSTTAGPVAGGTLLTVTGAGFGSTCPTGVSSDCPDASPVVLFGETEALATYVSPTQVTVTSPAHAAGIVSVSVRNRDTRRSPPGPSFSYLEPPPEAASTPDAALRWNVSGKTQLEWGATAGATGYRVYRGNGSVLPSLPTGAAVCTAYDGPLPSTGAILTATPAAGEFSWYLVAAYNGGGDGTLGAGSGTARGIITPAPVCSSP